MPIAPSESYTAPVSGQEDDAEIIVMKFGGTSVGNLDRIRASAALIKREVALGKKVAVVVSAMAGTTNELIRRCLAFAEMPDTFEYDAVISAGEQISSGLLALALQNLGVSARSFQGWQIPIRMIEKQKSDISFHVEPKPLKEMMDSGKVPVIAGFQGVDSQGRIATLGRGGSDATAVAVASALKADRCDIYTDVEGVYSGDPRMVEKAQFLSEITYGEMLAFAQNGAKVLQPLSVSLAMSENVPVRVLSAFVPTSGSSGTKIVQKMSRKTGIVGVCSAMEKAVVTLYGCSPAAEDEKRILEALKQQGIEVEASVIEPSAEKGAATWSLFMSEEDALNASEIICHCSALLSYETVEISANFSKIAVIGNDFLKNPQILESFIKILEDNHVADFTLLQDDFKIFAFTPQKITREILCGMHHIYGLDKPA